MELFVSENPDLGEELSLLMDTKLIPLESVRFEQKDMLLRPEVVEESGISHENYESFFVLYGDNELSNTEKAAVERFVYRNTHLQDEFEAIQKAHLTADASIIFPDKESLYKHEDDKVVPMRWWRIAAAAILLLAAGLFWINSGDSKKQPELASNLEIQTAPKKATAPATADSMPVNEPAASGESNTGLAATQEEPEISKAEPGKLLAMNEKTQQPVETTAVDKNMQSSRIESVEGQEEPIGVNRSIPPVEPKTLIIDQPTNIAAVDANQPEIMYASSAEEDQVEVLNTTVSKKNALRGLLRKASRFVSKRTGPDGENRGGILIGGFEIAVK